MNNNVINVCVCLPQSNDNRSPEEQQQTLDKFRALDERIQFNFVEYVDKQEIRALRGQPEFEKARSIVQQPSDELLDVLARTHVIFGVDLPFDMNELAPQLRWVQSVGAGIAQLQNCGLDKLDCLLTNGAGITADPIAEFVLARILSHWKLFAVYAENQQNHQWQQSFGRDLAGSTLGVVGYGAIGQAVAQRAKAWGMHVLASRRQVTADMQDPSVDAFYPIDDLDNMLGQCDAVALSAAETPDTYHLFNDQRFAAMPESSYFCNVSRGSLVDESALIRALESGHLSAASIDVAKVEPLPADDPLWNAPNLAISPHCSAALENFSRHSWRLFYENMEKFLAGEPLKNLRNTSYGG